MTESSLITLAVVILFLPLLGFTVTIFFGKKFSKLFYFEIFLIFVGFVLSAILVYIKLTYYLHTDISGEFTWIDFGNVPVLKTLTFKLGILLDNIAVIMILAVNLISFVVHLFSIDYMKGDKRYSRYFAYLGIFTFSMSGIVFTHNFLMMYIFWELVGLSSYLLIGFWFEKKSAADAGKKAFIVNRVGDIGMLIGILIVYTTYHTFTFHDIFSSIANGHLPFNSETGLTIAGLLLFCGAIGKSAQFPLHVWLPDAMEGPTPVSALIHAATMVAAGVFFVIRIFPMLSGNALLVIAIIGALSAFIPATIALTQNDIKRILAYSTISQLGYMIMAIGVGAYQFAFFHLITHAFFKACLFLGSGSVILAMHHEQDITKMGGLRKKMPLTYVTFVVASLAISGIPLTSGFLSKDGILLGSYAFASITGYWFFPFIGYFVAILTALYMFRLIILTFQGKPRDEEKHAHAHESPFNMVLPLIVLSGLSIFIWYTPNPFGPDQGWFLSSWVKTPEISVPNNARYSFMKSEINEPGIEGQEKTAEKEIIYSNTYMEALENAHIPSMILSLLMALSGLLLAFLIYQWEKISADKLAERFKRLYNLSYNKWYFDEFYNGVFVAGTLALSKGLAWFDAKIIDGIVNGTAVVTKSISKFSGKFDNVVVDGAVNFVAYFSGFIGLILRRFQTGKVQTYIIFVVFSLIILLFLFKTF